MADILLLSILVYKFEKFENSFSYFQILDIYIHLRLELQPFLWPSVPIWPEQMNNRR